MTEPVKRRRKNTYRFSYRHALIGKHFPLVRSIVFDEFPWAGESSDMLQEAYRALTEAAAYYDKSRGVTFGAFAKVIIKRALLEYKARSGPLHIGANQDRRSVVTGKTKCCTPEKRCERCERLRLASSPAIPIHHRQDWKDEQQEDTERRLKLSAAMTYLRGHERELAKGLLDGKNRRVIMNEMNLEPEEFDQLYDRLIDILRKLMCA